MESQAVESRKSPPANSERGDIKTKRSVGAEIAAYTKKRAEFMFAFFDELEKESIAQE